MKGMDSLKGDLAKWGISSNTCKIMNCSISAFHSYLQLLYFRSLCKLSLCLLGLETMGPAYRTFAGMMICLFFAVALMVLALVAYIFNSWKDLALVSSFPFITLFRYPKCPNINAVIYRIN